MAELKNHLDVYKLLPKSNCRKCGLATCLAFAAMVIQQTKQLGDCPHLEAETLARFGVNAKSQPGASESSERKMAELREKIKSVDLAGAAQKLGGRFEHGKLFISCLSKDFSVDQMGQVASGCHVNNWVAGPLLNYIISSRGLTPTGQWVPLRDLKGGVDWGRFFEHRCEKAMARLVDRHTHLFEDLIDIFDARPAPEMFQSDIAVVLYPLPKVPILICYWLPEDGMESSLNMFFDRTADENLGVEHLYVLAMGLLTMFEKIALTHEG